MGLEDPTPTYYRDVRPILEARCISCHNDGGIAPFPLDTAERVALYRAAIRHAVVQRTMPPWYAGKDCRDYVADVSLTDEQIQTIVDWVDADGPMGTEQAFQPLVVEDNSIERVDLTLTVPEKYLMEEEPDDYRCFLIEWPEQELKYVTGFNAVPDEVDVVHHIVSFVIPPSKVEEFREFEAVDDKPGYRCFGGPAGENARDFLSAFSVQWLSAWAPGTAGVAFPAGTGVPIEPGSLIAVQVHYNSLKSGALPDQSSIEISIADRVDRIARVVPFTSPQWTRLRPDGEGFDTGMLIPAGQKRVEHVVEDDFSFLFSIGEEFDIYGGTLHMHEWGKGGSVYKVSPDGSRDCVVRMDRWDFNWQLSYWFREPIHFRQGDKLRLQCIWDNSPENQPIRDGVRQEPKDIVFGDTTTDEMCVSVVYVVEPNPR